jgi:hypothetical protein
MAEAVAWDGARISLSTLGQSLAGSQLNTDCN